jgi:uncharacterized membrane protein
MQFKYPLSQTLSNFYENYLLAGILGTLLATTILFSNLIPPFQSPDEFEHIKRAYLLSTGDIVLKTSGAESSGGQINVGLLSYIKHYEQYPFKPLKKITAKDTGFAKQLGWESTSAFSPVYAFASYFPGLYAPQSIGLYLGKTFNFSVADSYQLARILAVLSSFSLITLGCLIFRPSLLVLAILFMPMSLYQLSSASLDGLATASFILILSIFFHTVKLGEQSKGWLAIPFGIFIFLLAASRAHALPVILLIFYSAYLTKNKKYLFAGIISALFIALWLYISIKTTVDRRVVNTVLPAEILSYYATNILSFFKVTIATLSHPDYSLFYFKSLLGNLGWADWPEGQFSLSTYYLLASLIIIIGISCTAAIDLKNEIFTRTLLLASALISTLIIFLALLVTWTTHPASLIEGVQGRYFHFPLLFLAYAITTIKTPAYFFKTIFSSILFIFYGLYSILITVNLLLSRFYISAGN